MNWKCLGSCVALLGALGGCGGGGGSAGNPINSGSASAVVNAADFFFYLDKTTIVNSGEEKALLTVTALDSNRNTLANVPVTVSLDGNGVLTDKSATVTNASGEFSGSITLGADKSNRTINASITVSGITKVASVIVTGSQIALTPVPALPLTGQQVTVNISTTDSKGNAIAFVDLALGGSAGAMGSVRTDASGNKSVTFTAPASAGTYEITASGLNITNTKTIQVIAAGGGTVPMAIGDISASVLSPQPSSITTNLPGSTSNRSRLSAKFLSADNAGIQNMRVRFEIVAPALGAGEAISTGGATIYTDSSGVAQADYIAGTRSSPTNGVQLRACYSPVDFASATDCPASVSANLTVAGAPLGISISDDNKLSRGLGDIAYLKQFLIQVNDAAGVAVKGAVVSASVDLTHYGKGQVWASPFVNVSIPTIRDLYADSVLPVASVIAYVPSLQTGAYVPGAGEKIWCVNEDRNRNGSLDAGEDLNSDSVIQPRKAEVVVSYVNGNQTDSNGQLLVQVSYGQNVGGWLAYTLRATTNVAGSEGDVSKAYVTNVLQADTTDGSFLTPPFGTAACNLSN